MTAPDQPKAPPTQRVSDALLFSICRDGAYELAQDTAKLRACAERLALDLRDTRVALADAQTALAAKDARIAELEAHCEQFSNHWRETVETYQALQPLDLDHLERVAREADDAGPWQLGEGCVLGQPCDGDHNLYERVASRPRSNRHDVDAKREWESNAAHIAAFDPPTALALIARLRAAEARADDAERRGWVAGRDAAAQVAADDDGHFSIWGENRNTAVSQQTCRDAAARIRALTPPQEPPTNG